MPQEKIIIKFVPDGHPQLIAAINALTKAQHNLKKGIVGTSGATGKHKKKQDELNKSTILSIRNQRLLGGAFATLRSKLLLATFGITMFLKPFARMGREAAKVSALTTAFDTLTGSTQGAVVSLNKLREATDNTMNSTDLLQQANNALILGVAESSDEMAEMFDVAQRLGRALGRDTASSVESLITGIGRQSRLMLDNIGIIVKAEEAYEAYAKKLNKTADSLTDVERKQAFFEATMASAREKVSRLGAETLTTQDIFNKAGASFDNLKVAIGDKLNPTIVGMTTKTANAADSMATFIRELDLGTVNDMKNELADLGATMKEISMAEAIRRIPDMFENLAEVQKQIRDFTKGIEVSGYEKLNNAMKENANRHIQSFNDATNLDDKQKALTATQKDLTDSQQASIVALMQLEKHKAGLITLTANEEGELTALVTREDARRGILSDLISLFKQDISQQQALALASKLVSQGIKDTNVHMMAAVTVTGDYNERIREKVQLARDDMLIALQGIELEEKFQAQFQKKVKASREDYELLQMRIESEKRLQDVLKVSLDAPDPAGAVAPLTEALDVQFGLITEDAAKRLELERQVQNETIELFKSGQMTEIEAREHYNKRMKELIAALAEEEKKAADEKAITFSEGMAMSISAIGAMTSAQSEQLNAEMRNMKAGDDYKNASSKKREAMETAMREKQSKERNSIAQKEKLASVAQATISVYESVVAALGAKPYGAWNIALAAGVGAMGFAQVASIASTPIPKFAAGGMIGGRRHSQGGTMIEAEQGEFIMSRSAVQSVGIENLNRMNEGGGSSAVTVNVSGNVLSQDFVEGELAENIKEAIRRGTDFGIS